MTPEDGVTSVPKFRNTATQVAGVAVFDHMHIIDRSRLLQTSRALPGDCGDSSGVANHSRGSEDERNFRTMRPDTEHASPDPVHALTKLQASPGMETG
ncbi:MAG: hypothetical protein OXF88_17200 [Rhodobacteraceae bacterium]|nr:hypothetical protein [Paracoccaceae bacterium]